MARWGTGTFLFLPEVPDSGKVRGGLLPEVNRLEIEGWGSGGKRPTTE